MSVTLSSISIQNLSSSFVSQELSFVNPDRNVNYINNTDFSSSLDLIYPDFTKYIKDISFNDNYLTFITTFSELSSYIDTLKFTDYGQVGFNMSQHLSKYDTVTNNFTQSYTAINTTQFAGIIDSSYKFNIFPLKTKSSITDGLFSIDENYKEYQKIYDINHSLFIQFKIDKQPILIEPDVYTNIYNSYDILSSYINDTDFVKNGAIGGNCPLNSDIIIFSQSEYGEFSNFGPNNINQVDNGTLLCLWLSSETPSFSSEKIWVERWYDPNTTTQGNAFITQYIDPSNISFINDVPSNKVWSEKERLTYVRYGPERNSTFVNSISSSLQLQIDDWGKEFRSDVNNISGFVIGDYEKSSDNLILNGSIHGHIPPQQVLFMPGNFSVSLWSYADNWSTNNDSQFFGNYYNETGYGLFYNTGTPNNLIAIPTSADNIFALNDRGFKVFEKDLKQDLGLSGLSINYIKTDLFGNRWLSDDYNKRLFKIENDDLVIRTVNLPTDASITKIDCNSNNDIFVLDTTTHHISSFDSSGTYLDTLVLSSHQNNFEIDQYDNVISESCDFITVNSQNQVIKFVGPTLFINGTRSLFLTSRPLAVRLDLEDNIWVLFENKILKTDSIGRVLFIKTLEVPFNINTGEMCFVKTHVDNSEVIKLWIVFNESKYVLIFDMDGNIIKRLDLSKLFIGKYCGTLQLNLKGDFTGFDNKRKFERLDGKIISPTNPSITLRLGLLCGSRKRLLQLHYPATDLNDWNHITFTIENIRNLTNINLYVNGNLVKTEQLVGNYRVNYGYGSSPFIIGGASGKLGAKNLEKSISKDGFFKGNLDQLKVYARPLNGFEILHLSLNEYFNQWKPITLYTSIPDTTMLEEIDTFHINRYRGFKSNKFNVKIKNLTTDATLQEVVKNYIGDNISQFIPANTTLNQIVFE